MTSDTFFVVIILYLIIIFVESLIIHLLYNHKYDKEEPLYDFFLLTYLSVLSYYIGFETALKNQGTYQYPVLIWMFGFLIDFLAAYIIVLLLHSAVNKLTQHIKIKLHRKGGDETWNTKL